MQFCVREARRIFSDVLQLFRAILAQDLRDLGASLELFCISTLCRLGEELQRCSAGCAAYVGRVHAYFERAVRRNSRKFAKFSRDFGAKFA